MPKVKTHSGAKKRFKVTATGKLKHFHSSHSHLMRKKSTKAKRRLRTAVIISPTTEKRMKLLLGI
jgi:large subunit ribosomal protein L35